MIRHSLIFARKLGLSFCVDDDTYKIYFQTEINDKVDQEKYIEKIMNLIGQENLKYIGVEKYLYNVELNLDTYEIKNNESWNLLKVSDLIY